MAGWYAPVWALITDTTRAANYWAAPNRCASGIDDSALARTYSTIRQYHPNRFSLVIINWAHAVESHSSIFRKYSVCTYVGHLLSGLLFVYYLIPLCAH